MSPRPPRVEGDREGVEPGSRLLVGTFAGGVERQSAARVAVSAAVPTDVDE
jgi:hypothetical protein